MSGKVLGVLGAVGLITLGGAGAAAATPTAAAPRWHVVKTVHTGTTGDFEALVATGKTAGWAFDQTASGPVAWERTGMSTWKTVPFPVKGGDEYVFAADAVSASDVWAFTDRFSGGSTTSGAVRWDGHTWSGVKLPAEISGASVPGRNDVWVFGSGAWRYNGHTWTRESMNLDFSGGSALSATDAWAFSGTNVYHWNGREWTGTSVKSLLPAVQQGLNHPLVSSILALSTRNVYAVGNGDAQDAGGPIVVLHYNGHKWSRVADGANPILGDGYGGVQVTTDGDGGLWIPTFGAHGTLSFLLHYSSGKLTDAKLPIGMGSITVDSVAHIPGTTEELTGGNTHPAYQPGQNEVAVILQYS
jgi:hypothetical protein